MLDFRAGSIHGNPIRGASAQNELVVIMTILIVTACDVNIVSVVMKLYEDMLQDEKKKRVTTIRYVLGSNIKSLRDFGTLLRRSISKEGKKV